MTGGFDMGRVGEVASGPLFEAERDAFGGIILRSRFGMTFVLEESAARACAAALLVALAEPKPVPLTDQIFPGPSSNDGGNGDDGAEG